MKITPEAARAFILELEALTRKHGISVDGCGCCGSPFLSTVDNPSCKESGYSVIKDTFEELGWLAPPTDNTSRDFYDSMKHTIVRSNTP